MWDPSPIDLDLVKRTAEELAVLAPGAEVTVDVAWSPDDIDGRGYDIAGLGKYADALFVMAYDIQSQARANCVTDTFKYISS